MPDILIIDDEEQMCVSLKTLLEKEGFSVDYSTTARKAFNMLMEGRYGLIICDIRMPEMGGLTFLSKIGTTIPVIMITAHASIETARSAFKLGASDYLAKPFKFDELLVIVKQFITQDRNNSMGPRGNEPDVFMESSNNEYIKVLELAEKFSKTDLPILITGESGTGKEVLSDYIYKLNKTKIRPESFVKINCAAIPNELLEGELFGYEKGSFTGAVSSRPGKIEEADGGILFLDEIGDMPLLLQAKILRVVQDMQVYHIGANKPIAVKTRIIAASNQDIEKLIEKGEFRLDLYHRLNGVHLRLPALRKRKEDLPALTDYFLDKYTRKYRKEIQGVSPEVAAIFQSYGWPGNIREFRYCIERSVVVCEERIMTTKCLPDNISINENVSEKETPPTEDLPTAMESYRTDYMRKIIINALEKANGNKVETAKLLNISRQTLYNRIRELDIQYDFR